jgi:NitT/TauT family transport system permease protein
MTSEAGVSLRSVASGASVAGPARFGRRLVQGNALPVLTVVAALVVIWYAGAVWLNAPWAYDQAGRAGVKLGPVDLVAATWSQDRPRLPAPHQVGTELWRTTMEVAPTSRRSLVYHTWITLSATAVGFGLGALLGVALAASIVLNRAMDASVMPWVIASQTIPILAIAPMIIVVLASLGVTGLMPKAVISMYLSFFPVAVGMVKGLRSPEPMLMDQMRTWNASTCQAFWKLRWPAAVPYLFASLKVGVAASLVGAIIGELPTGAVAGLGARMLSGSYFGQTVQIWSALVMAAILAACLVGAVGLVERLTKRAMGVVA